MSALVAFDLDGTLIDSQRDLADSTNELLGTYGAGPLPLERVAMMVGEGAKVLVERALAAAGVDSDVPDALSRFRSIYDRRLLIHTRPYPGIVGLIDSMASRAALAVLTNKPEAPSRRLLEAFDLAPRFRWVIGGDSGFPRKPDPAALEFLMASAGAGRDTTLLVGDSMIDVDTARRTGVRICVARYGFGQARGDLRLAPDDLVGDSADDIGRIIDAFLG